MFKTIGALLTLLPIALGAAASQTDNFEIRGTLLGLVSERNATLETTVGEGSGNQGGGELVVRCPCGRTAIFPMR